MWREGVAQSAAGVKAGDCCGGQRLSGNIVIGSCGCQEKLRSGNNNVQAGPSEVVFEWQRDVLFVTCLLKCQK